MKRFLAFILAALMLLTLAACSSNGGNTDPQPDNDQNQSDEPSKDDPTTNAEYRVQELFGYGFKLEYDAVEESSNYGHTAATEEYELFIYGRDNILFENWDNVTDIAFKQLGNAIDSAYSFYPSEQINSTSTKIENDYGETILKVSGTMTGNQAGEGTVERQFIAFYHVTDENYVRFCIGFVDNNYAALDAAMDTLIENLKKAA